MFVGGVMVDNYYVLIVLLYLWFKGLVMVKGDEVLVYVW